MGLVRENAHILIQTTFFSVFLSFFIGFFSYALSSEMENNIWIKYKETRLKKESHDKQLKSSAAENDGLQKTTDFGYKKAKVFTAISNVGSKNNFSETIVYTRVKRTTGEHTYKTNGVEQPAVGNWDYRDRLPEAGHVLTGFSAPGQLVMMKPDGSQQVIYDCKSPKRRACVPFDASVSLDGTKIAFSVYSSKFLTSTYPARAYPNLILARTGAEARIYIYTIATKTLTAWPHVAGQHDINPIWLQDGRILFSSTRNPHYYPKQYRVREDNGLTYSGPVTLDAPQPRMFIANEDGSNVEDISQHEFAGGIHPYLLSNGRVVYSSHWLSHNLPYIHTNGNVNWSGTTKNFWVLQDMDHRGGDMTAIIGAHRTELYGANPGEKTTKALHFVGQRNNGDICVENYYRANNLGLGGVVCFPYQGRGIEGTIALNFMPAGMYSLASWATSKDADSLKDSEGNFLGKIGFPEGAPDNNMILAVGRGRCTTVATGVPGSNDLLEQTNQIGCDVGLYKTTVIPSATPSDMSLIIDSPEWHEFGARVVKARTVATPDLSKFTTANGTDCEITSSDAGSTDPRSTTDLAFQHRYSKYANNGTFINTIPHSDLAAIRFYQAEPRTSDNTTFRNLTGNKLKLLGDVPLLADKSFKAKIPCNTPFLMVGVNADGAVIKRDQTPQSLRTGEKRVCNGCHLHTQAGRPYKDSLAFASQAVPLMVPTDLPTYNDDILPLFQANCTGCHNPNRETPTDVDNVPLYNYDRLVWDYSQYHVPASMQVVVDATKTDRKRRYGFQRPQTSKYINNTFALESLLYWKVAGQRTDGRTDATHSDDIDFGAAHPAVLDAAGKSTVQHWLDGGAPREK